MPSTRPALELISETADTAGDDGLLTTPAAETDWRAEAIETQWAPEHQLIGALLWLTAEQAGPILDLVPDTAIWRPIAQWAYETIRALVAAGRDPNPVLVLSTASQQPWALAGDEPPTAKRHHALAIYLAAAYTNAVSPVAAAGDYARQVLDDAYRRAFRDNGIRMQQLGLSGADRRELTEQFSLTRDALADLWRRCEAATRPGWWQP